MSIWRQFTRGLHVLIHRNAADRDVGDEVQHYLEQATAAHLARGLAPDAARRAAQLELGSVTAAREEVRTYGWENLIGAVMGDQRYAIRRLRHNPGFTIVSVVTLALGIGASTAIFSAVNPILFASLPYPEAGRIALISDVGRGHTPLDITFGSYRELLQRNHSFESMAVFRGWRPTMVGNADPVRLAGQRVSAAFFRSLGLAPAMGRDFQPSDDQFGGPNVVVLSDALWRQRFAGDRSVVGRTIKLDDSDYLVIGVMPRNFDDVLAPLATLWAPLHFRTTFPPESAEWGHQLQLVARLRQGVSLAQGKRELDAIARNPRPEFPRVPWASLMDGLITTSLQAGVTQAIRPALLAVLGAVLLLLVIACVNVTNLLLARGAQRRGEFAVRVALGAGRARLIRQLLAESLVLAAIGGALGMLAAEFGVHALVALSPAGLPRLSAIRLDGAVFAFGTLVTTVIGIMVGMIPAVHASRGELQAALQRSSRRTVGGHRFTRGALVVAEVALALLLLIGAGLLFRSIGRALAVPVGFDSSHLLTMQVRESGRRYSADSTASVASANYPFFVDALDAVRAVPGVTAAAFTALLPLSGNVDTYGVHFEDNHDSTDDGGALRYAVTPGYFDAMGIPLLRGRLLDDHDGPDAPRVVLLNKSFAARVFPGRDPIGRRLHFGQDDGKWYTVIGVVGDVKQSALTAEQPDAIYLTPAQWHWVDNMMSLVIRARGDAASLTPAVRRAIWSVDKDQALDRIATMDDLVDRSLADRHFALVLFEAFALTALILAATGIYGVLSGSVAERTREIGVRSALGASRASILHLVIRQGLTLTTIGVVLGLLGAFVATQAIATLLFGVSRLDPVTYLVVVVLLLGVSAVACAAPALRAARVDPAITLRAE